MQARARPRGALLIWTATALTGASGCQDPARPAVPASIALISGDHQIAKAGEPILEPLVVRVTDAQGNGLHLVQVVWRVTSGNAYLERRLPPVAPGTTLTGEDGVARATFSPTVLGPTTIEASIADAGGPVAGSPVTFTIDATTLVVLIVRETAWDDWGCATVCFEDPRSGNDVTVPLGMAIEWVNRTGIPDLVVRSSTNPSGGSPFDAALASDARFRFVPDAVGTWEYDTPELHEAIRARGTLTTVAGN